MWEHKTYGQRLCNTGIVILVYMFRSLNFAELLLSIWSDQADLGNASWFPDCLSVSCFGLLCVQRKAKGRLIYISDTLNWLIIIDVDTDSILPF